MPATSVARPAASRRPSGRCTSASSDELARRAADARPSCTSARPWRAKLVSSRPLAVRRATNARSPPSRALDRPVDQDAAVGQQRERAGRRRGVARRSPSRSRAARARSPGVRTPGQGRPVGPSGRRRSARPKRRRRSRRRRCPQRRSDPLGASAIAAGPVPSGSAGSSHGYCSRGPAPGDGSRRVTPAAPKRPSVRPVGDRRASERPLIAGDARDDRRAGERPARRSRRCAAASHPCRSGRARPPLPANEPSSAPLGSTRAVRAPSPPTPRRSPPATAPCPSGASATAAAGAPSPNGSAASHRRCRSWDPARPRRPMPAAVAPARARARPVAASAPAAARPAVTTAPAQRSGRIAKFARAGRARSRQKSPPRRHARRRRAGRRPWPPAGCGRPQAGPACGRRIDRRPCRRAGVRRRAGSRRSGRAPTNGRRGHAEDATADGRVERASRRLPVGEWRARRGCGGTGRPSATRLRPLRGLSFTIRVPERRAKTIRRAWSG